jgi:hypothetical protein
MTSRARQHYAIPIDKPLGTLAYQPRAGEIGRASSQRRAGAIGSRILVEGRYVSTVEIAAELGIHENTARYRLKRARQMLGPVTWAKLRGL